MTLWKIFNFALAVSAVTGPVGRSLRFGCGGNFNDDFLQNHGPRYGAPPADCYYMEILFMNCIKVLDGACCTAYLWRKIVVASEP